MAAVAEVQAQLSGRVQDSPELQALLARVPPDGVFPAVVARRDLNQRLWEGIQVETNQLGGVRIYTNTFVEISSGMNYRENGAWRESKEIVEIVENGAVARQGPHKVSFAANVNSEWSVSLLTPDNKLLKSRVLGLALYDYKSKKSVMIAELKDSVGLLVGENQVIYTNAFTDLRADIRYTYTKSGLEQDVILRERPPLPEDFDLNPLSTRLQVWTEFFDPPKPVRHQRIKKRWLQAKEDQSLDFGAMTIGYGAVFGTGEERGKRRGITTEKEWVDIDGRTFLIEDVSFRWITPHLRKLRPNRQAGIQKSSPDGVMYAVSTNRLAPKVKIAKTSADDRIQLASLGPEETGLVLDYSIVNSTSGFTFQRDTTYYVSGIANLSGTTIIEGGAVIKFNNDAELNILGTVDCRTDAYLPAILTAKTDNSVGETVTSGSPSGKYAAVALSLDNGGDLKYLRILYAKEGIYSPQDYTVKHSQFLHCGWGLITENATFSAQNVLMFDVGTNFFGRFYHGTAEHLTSHQTTRLTDDWEFQYYTQSCEGPPSSGISLVNSLLVGVTNSGIVPVSWNQVKTAPAAAGVFQTVAGGTHYLVANSTNRNAGTTSINAGLLADLKTKTTYPPIAFTNTAITSPSTLGPQAQRDTDVPDIGYHYDALDYVFGGCDVNIDLTFEPGTAVGWFRYNTGWNHAGHGIHIADTKTLKFDGQVDAHCYWVHQTTVQEKLIGYSPISAGPGGITGWGSSVSTTPVLNMRFTRCAGLPYSRNHFRDDYGVLHVSLNDCEFYSGGLGGYVSTVGMTNCLFDRASVWLDGGVADYFALRNCTARGGYLTINRWYEWQGGPGTGWVPVTILDCAFDGTTISTADVHATDPDWTRYDYNAFRSGQNTTYPPGANDVTVTDFNWQSSWLGDFYLPAGSALINAGSVSDASVVGFYHYTTLADQTKEATSDLDIGYHYVAMDGNGNPVDTDCDGTPDYLEDANGNGAQDGTETCWFCVAFANQPASQTVTYGDSVTFSVTTMGDCPISSYQWRKNGSPMPGATGTSFTIARPLVEDDQTIYDVVVSAGCVQIVSSGALLTVNPRPLSVTAHNKIKALTAPLPDLTGTLVGLQIGDEDITTAYSTTATLGSGAGQYPIIPALEPNDKLANYSVTLVNGTLTVDPDMPIANDGDYTTTKNTSIPITLSGQDPGVPPDPLTGYIAPSTTTRGGTLTGTAPYLTYTPPQNFEGEDTFTFTVTIGTKESAPATVTIHVGAPCYTKIFTSDTDFDLGTLENVNHNAPNQHQLQLDDPAEMQPYLNVACSGRGTMIRIDVNEEDTTKAIIGQYLTSPEGMGRDPSRTTVDREGNVWVANRGEYSEVDGTPMGSITKIGWIRGGERGIKDPPNVQTGYTFTPDPNGEWIRDTVANPIVGNFDDRDGDGIIHTSRGWGNILPWDNVNGVDSDGGVQTAEDELILAYVRVLGAGTRTVAVARNNDVWVGGSRSPQWHQKILASGTPAEGTEFSLGAGGYGGLIDASGILWSARSGSGLLRYDTATKLGVVIGNDHGDYGLGIDPQTGEIWHSSVEGGGISKYSPDGQLLGDYYHSQTAERAQGVVVDGLGNVWVAHALDTGSTVGHLRTDGTFIGNVSLDVDPNWAGKIVGPTGVAVDKNGMIWVANYNHCSVMRINTNLGSLGPGGTPVGEVDRIVQLGRKNGAGVGCTTDAILSLPGKPYNYSDMTGFLTTTAARSGTWTVIQDGGSAAAEWKTLSWADTVPADTALNVEVRVAEAEEDLDGQSYQTVANPQTLSGLVGRYMQIRVLFSREYGVTTSPVLQSLTVNWCDAPKYSPTIVSQPQDLHACPDGVASFSVIANGAEPLSYQWRFNGNAISGATDPTYTIAELDSADLGSYSVEVSNPYGSIISRNATLTFLQSPLVVVAKIADAKQPATRGSLAISRSCTAGPLTVSYTTSGTANTPQPIDYIPLSGTVVIPNGETTAIVEVVPIPRATTESKTVVLTVSPNAAYVLGSSPSATVTIQPNQAPRLDSIDELQLPANHGSYTITLDTLVRNARVAAPPVDVIDPDGDALSFIVEHVVSGSLMIDGIPYSAQNNTIEVNKTAVWTAPTTADELAKAAFRVRVSDGLASAPAPSSDPVDVRIAHKTQTSLYAWGDNWYGQLGNGRMFNYPAWRLWDPLQVQADNNLIPRDSRWRYYPYGPARELKPQRVLDLGNVVSFYCDGGLSSAIGTDGRLYQWGADYGYFLMGIPKAEADLNLPDNSVRGYWTWGLDLPEVANGYWTIWNPVQLFSPTPREYKEPHEEGRLSTLSDAKAISGSMGRRLMLRHNGTLWSWGFDGWTGWWTGYNNRGPLGRNLETANDLFPPASLPPYVGVGDAEYWRSGIAPRRIEIEGNGIAGGGMDAEDDDRDFVEVQCGDTAAIARCADHTVWFWGELYGSCFGGANDGSIPPSPWNRGWPFRLVGSVPYDDDPPNWKPQRVTTLEGGSPVVQVSLFANHIVVLREDGTVAELGYVARIDDDAKPGGWEGYRTEEAACRSACYRSVPEPVPNLTNIRQISAGSSYGVAVAEDGKVWIWGRFYDTDLMTSPPTDVKSPREILFPTKIAKVATDGQCVMAIDKRGRLWAWGLNYSGVFGFDDEYRGDELADYFHMEPVQIGELENVTDVGFSAWGGNVFALASPVQQKVTGLVATPGNQEVELSWDVYSSASYYKVYRSTVRDDIATYRLIGTASLPPYTDDNPQNPPTPPSDPPLDPLENGQTYYYVVSAVVNGVETDKSWEVSATPLPPPSQVTLKLPPTYPEYGGKCRSVKLGWTPVAGDVVQEYRIRRAVSVGGVAGTYYLRAVLPGYAKEYSDYSAAAGVYYKYKLTAVNSAGESADSAETPAWTIGVGCATKPHIANSWRANRWFEHEQVRNYFKSFAGPITTSQNLDLGVAGVTVVSVTRHNAVGLPQEGGAEGLDYTVSQDSDGTVTVTILTSTLNCDATEKLRIGYTLNSTDPTAGNYEAVTLCWSAPSGGWGAGLEGFRIFYRYTYKGRTFGEVQSRDVTLAEVENGDQRLDDDLQPLACYSYTWPSSGLNCYASVAAIVQGQDGEPSIEVGPLAVSGSSFNWNGTLTAIPGFEQVYLEWPDNEYLCEYLVKSTASRPGATPDDPSWIGSDAWDVLSSGLADARYWDTGLKPTAFSQPDIKNVNGLVARLYPASPNLRDAVSARVWHRLVNEGLTEDDLDLNDGASIVRARLANKLTAVVQNGELVFHPGDVGLVDADLSTRTRTILKEGSDGTWAAKASLGTSRHFHTATLLADGKVLVVGGTSSAGGVLASTEVYDPVANTWTTKQPLATARSRHTATLLGDGKVLVVGGENGSGNALSSVELYDPVANTWASITSLTTARSHHTATLLPDRQTVVIAGGKDGSSVIAAESGAEVYFYYPQDPGSSSPSQITMGAGRYSHAATLLADGRVLVVGGSGSGGSVLSSAEVYDPLAWQWTTTADPLGAGRHSHTATLLMSGKVLVTGGKAGSTILTSCEVYDPADDSWTGTDALAGERDSHTATLRSNGKVLVVGGNGTGGTTLSSAELYDSETEEWTTTGSLAAARHSHAATLLLNGSVLVTGGKAGSSVFSSSAAYSAPTYSGTDDLATLNRLLLEDAYRTELARFDEPSPAEFVSGDIEKDNISWFVNHLANSSDLLAAALWSRLQQLGLDDDITGYTPQTDTLGWSRVLAAVLTEAIQWRNGQNQPEVLLSETDFASMDGMLTVPMFTPRTKEMFGQRNSLTADEVVLLNRLLIEEAWSHYSYYPFVETLGAFKYYVVEATECGNTAVTASLWVAAQPGTDASQQPDATLGFSAFASPYNGMVNVEWNFSRQFVDAGINDDLHLKCMSAIVGSVKRYNAAGDVLATGDPNDDYSVAENADPELGTTVTILPMSNLECTQPGEYVRVVFAPGLSDANWQFCLERKAGLGQYERITETGFGLAYLDEEVINDQTYTYRVTAFDQNYNRRQAETAAVIPGDSSTLVLEASAGNSFVDLDWSAVRAASYEVKHALSADGPWDSLAVLNNGNAYANPPHTYRHLGAQNGIEHHYQVFATSPTGGKRIESNKTSATPSPALRPLPPDGFHAEWIAGGPAGRAHLTWRTRNGVAYYQIFLRNQTRLIPIGVDYFLGTSGTYDVPVGTAAGTVFTFAIRSVTTQTTGTVLTSDLAETSLIYAAPGESVEDVARLKIAGEFVTTPPAILLTGPTNLAIALDTSLAESDVNKITFYADDEVLLVVNSPPYQITWFHVPGGEHTIRASVEVLEGIRGIDAKIVTYNTDPVHINVTVKPELASYFTSTTDLQLPTPGLPISLTRAYDSRDTSTEVTDPSFWAIGWKANWKVPALKLSTDLGIGWKGFGEINFGGQYYFGEQQAHYVTITLPGGEIIHFAPQVDYVSTTPPEFYDPGLGGDPMTVALKFEGFLPGEGTLSCDSVDNLEVEASSYDSSVWRDWNQSGTPQPISVNFGSIVPELFTYTDSGDTKFEYEKTDTDLNYRIKKVTDSRGNSLRYRYGPSDPLDPDYILLAVGKVTSITHSCGRSVKFKYLSDETQVFDSVGSGQADNAVIKYIFSNNQLTEVRQLVDRTAGTYDVTRYKYGTGNPGDPDYNIANVNRLVETYDPRGVRIVQNVYRDDPFESTLTYRGDLLQQRDADAKGVTDYVLETDTNGKFTGKLTVTRTVGTEKRTMEVDHDESGAISGVTTPEDGTEPGPYAVQATYDERGRIIEQTDAEGNSQTFDYDDNGRLIGQSDELGNKTSVVLDSAGRPTSSTDANNNTSSASYDSQGNPLTATDAVETHTEYKYYEALAVGSTSLPKMLRQEIRTATRVPYNIVTEYEYKNTGTIVGDMVRMTQKWVDENEVAVGQPVTVTYEYDNNGNRTAEIKTRTVAEATQTIRSESSYDAQNRIVTTTTSATGVDPLAPKTITIKYNKQGQKDTVTDDFNRVTKSRYDHVGRLIESENADHTVTRTSYDAFGQAEYSQDQTNAVVTGAGLNEVSTTRGPAIRNTYDAANRIVKSERIADLTMTRSVARSKDLYPADYDFVGTGSFEIQYKMTASSPGAVLATTRIEYDALGREQYVMDARGNVTEHGYDAASRRTSVIRHKTPIAVDAPSLEPACKADDTCTTDPECIATTFGYDRNGNQIWVKDALERQTDFEYDEANRRTRTIFPAPDEQSRTTRTTIYNGLGQVFQEVDEANVSTVFSYDFRGLMTSTTVAAGTPQQATTIYAYDEVGNLIKQTDAQSQTGDTPRATVFTYDALGRRTSRALPGGVTEYHTYGTTPDTAHPLDQNPPGAVLASRDTMQDFSGRITTITFDRMNRLVNKVLPSTPAMPATTVTYSYDKATGRTTTETQAGGVNRVVRYAYDGKGNLRVKETPEGTLSYEYDDFNAITKISSKYTYTWPALSPNGAYVYDAAFEATRATSNPNGAEWNYRYDKYGRLLKVNPDSSAEESPADATYEYDELGKIETMTYRNGATTTYTYNNRNWLRMLDTVLPGNPATPVARFDYDGVASTWPAESLLSPTGQRRTAQEVYGSVGRAVGYTYDVLRRLTVENIETGSSGPVGTVHYDAVSSGEGYDKVGNRRSRQVTAGSLPGVTSFTGHAFDERDRLNADNGFTYDANGNTIAEAGGATYGYDAQDRLVKRTGGALPEVALSYDADGNRVTKTVNGVTTYYLVENRNPTGYAQVMEERAISEPATTSLVGRWRMEEGTGTTVADDFGTAQNGTLLNGTVWGNGPVGGALHFDGINDYVNVPDPAADLQLSTMTIAFWYKKDSEPADWVRLVGKGDSTYRNYGVWEEAGAGKRILFQIYMTSGSAINFYSTVNLEVGQWYHVACTYDGSTGRIYINGAPAGQQTVAGTPRTSTHPLTFGYAGFHTYLKGALDEVRIYNQVLGAGDVAGLAGTSCQYVYGLDLISQKRGGTVRYYGYDGLGSVRYLTDGTSGAVTDTYTYDAFGIQIASTGSTENSYRYTGEQWDADLEMYYLRARYYKPEIGRFWTMDSFEGNPSDPLSLHKYLYCHDNPVNGTDPSGHEFNFIGMLSALTTAEGLQGMKATGDVAVRWELREMQKDLLETFSPTDRNQRLGEAGERVWEIYLNRIKGFGVRRLGKPGQVGPDIVGAYIKGGRVVLLICEVKASRSYVPGAGRLRWLLTSKMRQMSTQWIDHYASKFVDGLIDLGLKELGGGGMTIRRAIDMGNFEAYILGAWNKKFSKYWEIQGWRLLHFDGADDDFVDKGGFTEITRPRTVLSDGTVHKEH